MLECKEPVSLTFFFKMMKAGVEGPVYWYFSTITNVL